MQNVRNWTSSAGNGPLSRTPRIPHSSALLAANTRAQHEIGHPPTPSANDERGHALHQLREHLNIDPVLLATQACISLRQLYQLESGESTLFYNSTLRDQAGRRIANLLGVQWETLGKTPLPIGQDKTHKVVNLHPALSAIPVVPAVPVVPSVPAVTTLPDVTYAVEQTAAEEAPPLGLHREATETLTLPTPTNAQIRLPEASPNETATHPSHWPRTLLTWTLAALAGTATGWLITTQPHLHALISALLDQLH